MEPAPPPITIVNPNAPTGTADLLDSGSDRWRPTGRQKLLVAMAALIVALIAAGVAEIQHVHHERALDAAAIKDVSLAVHTPADYYGDDQLLLLNGGTLPVRVVSVALVGDGYAERQQDVAVTSGTNGQVQLSTSKNCRVAMYTEQAEQVRVRVRTARGDLVSRVLPLPSDLADGIGRTERDRCGFLRPGEALGSNVVSTERRGRDVVVTLDVHNAGRESLTITRLDSSPGLAASVHLPVALPARAFWTGQSRSTRLVITLRITDCVAYAGAGTNPEFDSGFMGEQLVASLRNNYTAGQAPLWLTGFVGDYGPGDPPAPDIASLLRDTCPSVPFPQPGTVPLFQ